MSEKNVKQLKKIKKALVITGVVGAVGAAALSARAASGYLNKKNTEYTIEALNLKKYIDLYRIYSKLISDVNICLLKNKLNLIAKVKYRLKLNNMSSDIPETKEDIIFGIIELQKMLKICTGEANFDNAKKITKEQMHKIKSFTQTLKL